MRIFKSDNNITVLAKKAAMICEYSICNPLHVFFEDCNFHTNPMDFERECNEIFKSDNGQHMFDFIETFLDEWDKLTPAEKLESFHLFHKKWKYLHRRWKNKILENSTPKPKGAGFVFAHYLGEDDHIYVKTDKQIELLQF